jgi:hypothetical protein
MWVELLPARTVFQSQGRFLKAVLFKPFVLASRGGGEKEQKSGFALGLC